MVEAHKLLKDALRGPSGAKIVETITRKIYPWAKKIPSEHYHYKVFTEFTIRYDSDEQTRLGLERKKHYLIDAVLFIEPGFRALNQGQVFTVAIEIKQSINDLRADDKLEMYADWCDYYYIGIDGRVPLLAEDAIERASRNSKIGVLDIVNARILRWPEHGEIIAERQIKLLQNALYSYAFPDIKKVMKFADFEENATQPAPDNQPDDNYQNSKAEDNSGTGTIGNNQDKENSQSDKNGENKYSEKPEQHSAEESENQQGKVWRKSDAETIMNQLGGDIAQALTQVDPTAVAVYGALTQAVVESDKRTQALAEAVGISNSQAANALAALKRKNLIDFKGSAKIGHYEINPTPPVPPKYKGKCLKCDLYNQHLEECNNGECSKQL